MFGGFGQQQQQNQQQPNTGGFGAFGQNQPSAFGGGQGAFGQPQQPQPAAGGFGFGQTQSAFGSQPTTGASAFGQPAVPATSGFGQPATTGAFGGSAFGGGGFGSTAAPTTGFGTSGGFGATSGTAVQPAASTGFGSTNTGGGLFGQPRPGGLFGSSTTSAFGQPQQQTTSVFGSTTSAFGGGTTGGFGGGGAATSDTINNGTGTPAYAATHERDSATSTMNIFQHICAMPAYKNWSPEELRVQDYTMNKKLAGQTGAAPGGFGQPQTTTATSVFGGAAQPATNTFGFGGAAAAPFGQQAASTAPAVGGGLFGQPAATAATTTGTTGFGFGTQQQQQPFGTANAFGQQPATTTGAFGQPAAPATTSGFGFGTQQPAATGFGSNAFGQPATTTGFGAGGSLFGKTATTAPGTTGGFGFGAQPAAAAAPATGGLFGQPAATQPQTGAGGGLFGQKPAFGGGFGATATTTGAATTGFGAAQAPATNAFGGGFGQPAAQAPAAGGLFGQPAASTAPGFGQATSTAAPGGGLFGAPAATSGGLFGNATTAAKPFSLGGATGTTTAPAFGGFGTSTGTAAAAPSLFGQSTTTPAFGLGAAATNTGSSLFPQQQQQQQQPSQGLQASIDKNPYGNNPLFNAPVTAGSLTTSAEVPLSIPIKLPEKKVSLAPQFQMTPKATSKIKLRGFTPSPMVSAAVPSSSVSPSKGLLFPGAKEESILALDPSFTPRKSMKKLVVDEKKIGLPATPGKPSSLSATPATIRKSQDAPPSTGRKNLTVQFDPNLEAKIIERSPEPPSKSLEERISQNVASSASSSRSQSNGKSPIKEPPKYAMSPSLSELLEMTDEELQSVENFEVKMDGIGSVKFLEPVDLLAVTDRKGIKQIPGTIVQFQPRMCIVYPDEEEKPPVGVGLNVPAEIKLYGCWALDKQKNPIKDEDDPKYDIHLEKLENMKDTTYIGFHKPSGCWRFRVEHFSRYGLADDEEEEEETQAAAVPVKKSPFKPKQVVEQRMDDSIATEEDFFEYDSFAHIKGRKPQGGRFVKDLRKVAVSSGDEEEEDEDFMDEEEEEEFSGSEQVMDMSAEEEDSPDDEESFNEMTGDDQGEMDSTVPDESVREDTTTDFALDMPSISVLSEGNVPPPSTKKSIKALDLPLTSPEKRPTPNSSSMVFGSATKKVATPMTLVKSIQDNLVEKLEISVGKQSESQDESRENILFPTLKTSVLSEKHGLKEPEVCFSRSFRASWAPDGSLIVCRSPLVRSMSLNPSIVRVVKIQNEPIEQVNTALLESILAKSEISLVSMETPDIEVEVSEQEGEQYETVAPSVSLLSSLLFKDLLASNLNEKSKLLLNLCHVLFDPVEFDGVFEDPIVQNAALEAIRKQNISNWLENAVLEAIEKRNRDINAAGKTPERAAFGLLFNYLAARQLENAVKAAIKTKNYHIGLYISQLGGPCSRNVAGGVPGRCGTDENVREYANEQVQIWKKKFSEWSNGKQGSVVDPAILKCWLLIAGNRKDWNSSLFEGLDWKLTLGLFIWYSEGGWNSIKEAVGQYEAFVSKGTVQPPFPAYFQALSDAEKTAFVKSLGLGASQPHDMAFQLLKLFTDDEYPLEQALRPEMLSNKLNEWQMPWIVCQILSRALKIKQFRDSQAVVLETVGADMVESELSGFTSVTSDDLSASFARQLEVSGHWTWACFVALFLGDTYQREKLVKRIISVNKSLKFTRKSPLHAFVDGFAMNETEESEFAFLVDRLRIPLRWINEAMLWKAQAAGNALLEGLILISLHRFKAAHRVFVTKVGPDLILQGTLEKTLKLLNELPVKEIPDWNVGGGLLVDYISVVEKCRGLLVEPISTLKSESIAATTLAKYKPHIALAKDVLKRIILVGKATAPMHLSPEHQKHHLNPTEIAVLECFLADAKSRLSRMLSMFHRIGDMAVPCFVIFKGISSHSPSSSFENEDQLQEETARWFDQVLKDYC